MVTKNREYNIKYLLNLPNNNLFKIAPDEFKRISLHISRSNKFSRLQISHNAFLIVVWWNDASNLPRSFSVGIQKTD